MKKSLLKRLSAGLALATMMTSVGCSLHSKPIQLTSQNMMEGIKARKASDDGVLDGKENEALTQFALNLLKESNEEGGNILLSPLSVALALNITANGANGETLKQMEELLGVDIERLNQYLYNLIEDLPSSETNKLSIANSIWIKDEEQLVVEQDFLETNAKYYDAEVYKANFDERTKRDINAWVKENTNGRVQEIIDQIQADTMVYIINALAFDAQWEEVYEYYQIKTGTFTTDKGKAQKVDFMYSEEELYIQDDQVQGFIKPYENRDYSFVAILPNEGIDLANYIETLDGAKMCSLLENTIEVPVRASIPKFKSEYSIELKESLQALGMVDAFDVEKADFSALAHSEEGNIFVGRVIHKTTISVDEKGTEAGAATAVELKCESALEEMIEPKMVYLERPFIYAIIENETNLPVFIGTTTHIENK